MYLITNNPSECCGCSACEQICGHGALRMTPDKDGFIFPVKNLDKCTNCGLCERVCPYNHVDNEDVTTTPSIYATYCNSVEERQKSSSGALFYMIAKNVIENGGIVYGASFDKELQVHHTHAETLDQLQSLRGSKYVQSQLNDKYREIRSHLQKRQIGLFYWGRLPSSWIEIVFT